jgi:WS/DGAT/MGAT family acyltransferase
MAKELNRFLTTLDASFLYFERPKEPLHIGSCMVYEGRIGREELRQVLLDRLHLCPRYRQKVVFPPFGVSHPLWIDDPDFDVDQHIDEVEMEGPNDDRALAEYAAEAYTGMLDRSRPLWHATLIHGLEDDNTAIVWKVHHAMIDGVSGVELTMVLNDYTPDAEGPPPGEPWQPKELPDVLNLLQESVQHRLAELARGWTDSTFDALRPDKASERLQRMMKASTVTLPTALQPAPRTPFNKPVSGEIGYAWSDFSFAELRQVKAALGGTVNDLVLTILSGALGRYLRGQGEHTDGVTLRAMCPVSMRMADEQGQLGNLVSTMVAPLFVGIEDPRERLEAEKDAMRELKEAGQAEALYDMTQLGTQVPPAWQALAGLIPAQQTLFNTVSTNVPGPQIPLYSVGRKLLAWLPMGVVSNNLGLFVAILTYNQKITLGTTVDRRQIPDPWVLSQCIRESYEELRELAGVEVDDLDDLTIELSKPVRKPTPARASSARKKKRSAKASSA